MNRRLLITGGNGQVATEYQFGENVDGWDFYFLTREELDITKMESIVKNCEEIMPDAILNLAAYTNVEKAEKEETSKAFDANSTGPKMLAMACKKMNIPLIHISTDYVFDGNVIEPYTEKSIENPINQYGRTKYLGEKWIQECHDWYYIIRVSWVYSSHSKNFFTSMLKLAQERSEISVVDDQFGSPTSAKEVCRAIDTVLKDLDKDKTGVYHFAGLGRTTWNEFAAEIFRQSHVNIKVNGVPTSSWPSKVERPSNSHMSSEKFADTFGIFPLHWKNALTEVISESKIIPIKVGDSVMLEGVPHIIITTDWLKRIARIAPKNNLEKSVEIPFELLML
jgi:dTDP-4-dehydrorhamnose reductase